MFYNYIFLVYNKGDITNFTNERSIMKSTGIVRKVDELGRVVIPIELRRTLNIDVKDALEIFTSEDTIILRKYNPLCYICGDSDGLITFKNKRVCSHCISDLKEIK